MFKVGQRQTSSPIGSPSKEEYQTSCWKAFRMRIGTARRRVAGYVHALLQKFPSSCFGRRKSYELFHPKSEVINFKFPNGESASFYIDSKRNFETGHVAHLTLRRDVK